MYVKYETWYQNISTGLRKQPGVVRLIYYGNQTLTLLFYAAYPVLLIWEYVKQDERFTMSVLIPAAFFLLTTLARRMIKRPRPFAACNIEPLFPKENKNDSMPSRHVFSSVIITMVIGSFFPAVGAVLFLLCILLGLIRILAGIHYPSDVLTGILLGILGGMVYLFFT